MAHGADHGKAVAGQSACAGRRARRRSLRCDAAQSFAYACYSDYLEAISFQRCPQHIADQHVVLGQQNLSHRGISFLPHVGLISTLSEIVQPGLPPIAHFLRQASDPIEFSMRRPPRRRRAGRASRMAHLRGIVDIDGHTARIACIRCSSWNTSHKCSGKNTRRLCPGGALALELDLDQPAVLVRHLEHGAWFQFHETSQIPQESGLCGCCRC